MRYNVSQLLKAHVGESRHYSLQEPIDTLDNAIKPLSDLTGNVDLIRTNDGVLVRANLRTNVELTCSRCLVEFGYPVRFQIDEEYHPTIDIVTGARLPQPEDVDRATLIDDHHILDLTEMVRQNLTLEIPMVPVCRNNCQGLCPICGKNRNDEQCNHEAETLDPRLAILKNLLDESEQNN